VIENHRMDLFLFVEEEQDDSGTTLRPSTLLGWQMGPNGLAYPITPMTGVVTGGWALFDAFHEIACGHTSGNTVVTPANVARWVRKNLSDTDCDGDCENCPDGPEARELKWSDDKGTLQ
jgi:hypothetical protein